MRETLSVFELPKSSVPGTRHPKVYFPSPSPRAPFRHPRATPAAVPVL
jgi:hypothetical protein